MIDKYTEISVPMNLLSNNMDDLMRLKQINEQVKQFLQDLADNKNVLIEIRNKAEELWSKIK